MKKLTVLFALVWLATGVQAALPQPDLIAQIRFAGVSQISAAANFSAFTNEFCSAEAVALRAQTADKLSAWLPGWLQANVGVPGAGGAAKLRPLFDDLQKSAWMLEARAAAGGRAEVAIAIQLEAARARLWQANLKALFPAATFQSSGGWLIFESGTGAQKIGDRLAPNLALPLAGWFSADVNWPRLAQWYPKLKELGLPETQFAVTAPDASLRIAGKWLFPQNLALSLEPWRMPTETIHAPFTSFTAVRGFAAWLPSQPWAQACQLSPPPNQLFTWALPQLPYQSFAAAPVPDAAAAGAQAYARLQPVFGGPPAARGFLTPISLRQTNGEIVWTGVPFIAPFVRPLKEASGQYLLAGTFPNTPRGQAVPPEHLQRLAANNQVLYHWENTAERVPQVLTLSQLGLVLTSHRQLGGPSAAFKWIQKVAPALGASTTDITQTGPAELTFRRQAAGLFTAVEMFALANWLEAPDFPGCNLQLPPPSPRIQELRQKNSGRIPAPKSPPPPAAH